MRLATERKVTFSLFLFIPVFLFLVFFIYPVCRSIVLSLHSWDGISPSMTFVGLRNYARLLESGRFLHSLANNAKWLVFSLLVPTSLGLILALMIDQKIKGEAIFKTIFFLPYTITPVAVGAVWRWLYEPSNGLINRILILAGLEHSTQVWLGDPAIATYSIMFASLWWTTGFSFVLYLSGLRNIPVEVIEAARIDGTSFSKLFFYVMFPMLLPSTIVVLAMSGISAMRVFDIIYALTGGGPAYATDVLATQMYDVAFNRFEMGVGSALAVILLLLSVLIILPYVYYSSQRLEGIRQ